MFGRLSQLAQNVQQSFNADESTTSNNPNTSSNTFENLRDQLEESEERNKRINKEFKKLLKEKEEQIKSLKEGLGGSHTQDDENKDNNDYALLKRKTEEYKMLIEQKDESIQHLMASLKETEDLKDQIEEQERKNTEKLMFELAERIRAHETIQRKMEELRHVMDEKDNAVHNMADQMAAQDELLKAKEEVIKKLKRMAAGSQATEEMISTLQKAIQSKDSKINEMAQSIDKLEIDNKLLDAKIDNRDGLESSKDQTIEALWAEIKQKNDMVQQFTQEKDDMLVEMRKKEQEIRLSHERLNEKDMELNELNMKVKSIEKESEMKMNLLESSSIEKEKEVNQLRDQLVEANEIVKSKLQAIEMFQKEIDEKDGANDKLLKKLNDLQVKISEDENKLEEMRKVIYKESEEKQFYKEKFESEENEKDSYKSQLDKVGSELMKEIDQKAAEIEELQGKLESLTRDYSSARGESESLAQQLISCQENGKEKSKKIEEYAARLHELEQEKEVSENVKEDLILKEKELKEQQCRFDEELNLLKSENENERGSAASYIAELESMRRETEEKSDKVLMLKRNNKEMKEELDISLKKKESLDNEFRALQISLKEMEAKVARSRDDNVKLMKKIKDNEESANDCQRSLEEECKNVNQQIIDMETAMNHMVEKLNLAELKISEYEEEKIELNDKLKQGMEEKAMLDAQKTEIEIALDEFVKSTESRKRRNERPSGGDSDSSRPNDGYSGYNTPVSVEESPKSSSYIEVFQPAQANFAGNLFEGRAIGDIFKLVEEERNSLEGKVTILLKENEQMRMKLTELEDYLELEKQKFKQASEQISELQDSFKHEESHLVLQLSTLQQENSSLKQLQAEFEDEKRRDEEIMKGNKEIIENFENELKVKNDNLEDKMSELSKMNEVIETVRRELESSEENVEKLSKQNRQMKNKMKGFLKEKSEKETTLADKQYRIEELENLNSSLNESVSRLEPLMGEVKQKETMVSELENESYLKNVENVKLKDEIIKLKQTLKEFEEVRKTEMFESNERFFEVDQALKLKDEAIHGLTEELSTKSVENGNLNSTINAQKEQLLKLKEYSASIEEDIIKLRNMIDEKEEQVKELSNENKEKGDLIPKIQRLENELQIQAIALSEKILLHESEYASNSDMINSLKDERRQLIEQLTAMKEEVLKNEHELQTRAKENEELQLKMEELEGSDKEIIDGLSQNLSSKEEELKKRLNETENLQSKIEELEQMITGKDAGLKDIVEGKNCEIENLKVEIDGLSSELLNAKREVGAMESEMVEMKKDLECKTMHYDEGVNNMKMAMEKQSLEFAEKEGNMKELKKLQDGEVECLQAKILNIQNVLAEQKLEKDNLAVDNSDLKSRLESEKSNLISLDEESRQQREEFENIIRSQIDAIKSMQLEMNKKTEELAEKSNEVDALVKDNSNLKMEKDELKLNSKEAELTQIEQYQKKEDAMIERINEIETQLLEKDHYISTVSDIAEKLKEELHEHNSRMEELSKENDELRKGVDLKDNEIAELEKEINNLRSKTDEVNSKKEEKIQILENDISFLQGNLDEKLRKIDDLESLISEKDLQLETLNNEGVELKGRVENLTADMNKCNEEFDKEREMFADRLSALNVEIKEFEERQVKSTAEIEDLKKMLSEKEDEITQMSVNSEMKLHELSSSSMEENTVMKKSLEEYKAKVMKKMKSLKEEIKVTKANASDEISQLTNRIEAMENEKQEIISSLELSKQRIAEIESLNESREENLRNCETEMTRFVRLMQDRNDEMSELEGVLRSLMEEKQSLLENITKKDEKLKLLQEQLISNEEDMMLSFSEKDELVNGLRITVIDLEQTINEKEMRNSELSQSLLVLEDKLAMDKEDLEARLTRLEDEKISLMENNRENKTALESLHEQLSEKWREIETLKKADHDKISDYANQILSLQNEMENRKKTTDEFRNRAAKKMKNMKETTQSLNETIDSLNKKIIAKDEELQNNNIEQGRLRQRMNDKEEELLTVKEMMQNSLQEMQLMQDELTMKGNMIEEMKEKMMTNEELLNESAKRLEDERACFITESSDKDEKLKALETEFQKEQEKVQYLENNIATRLQEMESLKEGTSAAKMDKDEEISESNNASRASIEFEENNKELEAVKLKLAKAIKRIGTMKKDQHSKEEMIDQLNKELKSFKEALESQAVSQNDVTNIPSEIIGREEAVNMMEDIEKKDEMISALEEEIKVLKSLEVPKDSPDIVETVGCIVDQSLMSVEEKLTNEPIQVEERLIQPMECVETEALKNSEVDGSEIDRLVSVNAAMQCELDSLKEQHSKQALILEKFKKKVAILKKVELKQGKENDGLKMQLQEETEKTNELIIKMQECEVNLADVKTELHQTTQQKGKEEAKNEDLKKLVEIMAEEKHELDSEMKDILAEIKEVMDIKNTLLHDLKVTNDKLAKAESDCHCLRQTLDDKEAQLLVDQQNLQELKARASQTIELKEENAMLNHQVKDNEKEIEEISKKLVSKSQECYDLNSSHEELKKRLEEAENSKIVLSNDLMKVEERLNAFKTKEEDDSELQKNMFELKAKVENLLKVNSELEEVIQEQKEKIEERHVKEAGLNEERENMKHRQVELENIVSSLEMELKEKDLEIENMKKLQEEGENWLQNSLDDASNRSANTLQELKDIKIAMEEQRKEFEVERATMKANIDELKLSVVDEKEKLLQEEMELFQEKLKKEKGIWEEEAKIEKSELIKSQDESIQSVGELEEKVDKLTAEKQHKDTVIAKLKLKLKQTIKDRDVIKNNLQSEIERLTQDRDIIFNEFQTKTQQTESEFADLRSTLNNLENVKDELETSLSSKQQMESEHEKKIGDVEKQLEVAVNEKTLLQENVESLEKEIESKIEIVEKFEWEASEKEDQVRDLERRLRSFVEDQQSWEELKKTLEDTIEVKEGFLIGLRKELEISKSKAIENEKVQEEKMVEIEEQLLTEKEKNNLNSRRVETLEKKQKDACEVLGLENVTGDELLAGIVQFKEKHEDEIAKRIEEVEQLKDEVKLLAEQKEGLQHEMDNLKEDFGDLRKICIGKVERDDDSEDVKLKEIIEQIVSKKDELEMEATELSNLLTSEKEAHSKVQDKYKEQFATLHEIKAFNYEDKIVKLDEELKQKEMEIHALKEEVIKISGEVNNIERMLSQKEIEIGQLQTEKSNLDLQVSELQTQLDLNELNFRQMKVDKENSSKQLEILLEEANSLKSTRMPELQSVIEAKNKSMLELRENFGEVIADKDGIITSLRDKIAVLQQQISDTSTKQQEQSDSFHAILKQKNEFIEKLSLDVATVTRNSDWLKAELNHVIEEKDSIGGSIQNQFEDISEGLRSDIDLFMKDKKQYETEFQIERLQLEKSIAEQQQQINELEKKLNNKDKYVMESNLVIDELKRRVEVAANILSKESYYEHLEEKLDDSYKKFGEASEMINTLESKLRANDELIEELKLQRDIINGERDKIVMDYEERLGKAEQSNNDMHQSFESRLNKLVAEKGEECMMLNNEIQELKTKHEEYEKEKEKEFLVELGKEKEKNDALVLQLANLQEEKEKLRNEIMNEAVLNTDGKMTRIKNDFQNVLRAKDQIIEKQSSTMADLNEQVLLLTDSSRNLSQNLFALEKINEKLELKSSGLENSQEDIKEKHREEIDRLLISKGKDFQVLRTQFEETLSDKENILNNLRERLNDLHLKYEEECIKNGQVNAEKDELMHEKIRKDLAFEKLKTNVDSLLNAVGNLEADDRGVMFRREGYGKQENDASSNEESKDKFENNIIRAKIHLESFIARMKTEKEQEEDVVDGKEDEKSDNDEELTLLKEDVNKLQKENEELRNMNKDIMNVLNEIEPKSTDTGVKSSNVDAGFSLPASITNMIGIPRAVTGLQILASEALQNEPVVESEEPSETPDEQQIDGGKVNQVQIEGLEEDAQKINELKDEIRHLKSVIVELENNCELMESKVRQNFDDILLNLREDLQTSLRDNNALQAEIFMLKNLGTREITEKKQSEKETSLGMNTSTQTDMNIAEKDEEMLMVDGWVQTESNTIQEMPERKQNEIIVNNEIIKRYSSSERLPEVVEDTLCSKMDIEQLQTFSDNSLEGETFESHPKLELRLSEDGDKLQNIKEMKNEIEVLKSKLDQTNDQEYKNELNELQLEKFEQVRIYEDELNNLKQEYEEGNQEKLRKEQEIRSLREEINVLVKEKADGNQTIKEKLKLIRSKAEKDLEMKHQAIELLCKEKDDLKDKILKLEKEVELEKKTKEELQLVCKDKQAILDEQSKELIDCKSSLESESKKISELQLNLNSSHNEITQLEGMLCKTLVDKSIDNPGFDEDVIESYIEQIERKDVELGEAFDMIRALEKNQIETEKHYESNSDMLNALIDSHEQKIDVVSEEKLELQKSMQEMRSEVEKTISERNDIVNYWRNEADKIAKESNEKIDDLMKMNDSIVQEHSSEINKLKKVIHEQTERIETLQKEFNENKEISKQYEDLRREHDEVKQQNESEMIEMKKALDDSLQSRHLLEDKLAFYEHQMEIFEQANNDQLDEVRKEIETAEEIIQRLRSDNESKERIVGSLEEEIGKYRKKMTRLKKEADSSLRGNEEQTQNIRNEMENVLKEVQDEKELLYSDLLAKERSLQETRIHADQLMKEKELWITNKRNSGNKETELLLQSSDGISRSSPESLSLQIQQLNQEKDTVVLQLENQVSQMSADYFNLEKSKRLGDLQIAELKAKLKSSETASIEEKKDETKDKIVSFKNEMNNIKGDFEALKKEATNFTTDSKNLLSDLETELTSFVLSSANKQKPQEPVQIESPVSEAVELKSFLSDESSYKLEDQNAELEGAKQQIAMLEESLYSWKDRCVDLEEQLQRNNPTRFPNRSGSEEYLINIDDNDEGPSIETARAGLGQNAQRLMKYSTSGMQLKTRARSFFSNIFKRQRGPVPVRKLLLMTYALAIHILAFMSIYCMASA
eukprot:gene12652-13951_t